MSAKLITIVVSIPVVLVAACGEDTVEPCDLWVGSAVVSGRVTDSGSGGPIVNTEVEVMVATHRRSQCDGGEEWGQTRRVFTDNAGQFKVELELGNVSGVRCVAAREINSGVLVRGTVEFVGGCDETGPPGQLNLDVSI